MPETRPLAAQEVADRVRARIIDGSLGPGQRIKQEDLARESGTSRIPVRDALTQLNHEGLIALTNHAGARVATLSAAELDEIYLLRERVEPVTLAASVRNLSAEAIDDLEEWVLEMERAGELDDPSRWVELDRQFHLASYRGAALPEFRRLIESLWNRTQQYRRAYTRLPESFETAQLEHRLLLRAIRDRDAVEAETISGMHIRRTRFALRENSGLFEWST